jgi:cell division protein FtsL
MKLPAPLSRIAAALKGRLFGLQAAVPRLRRAGVIAASILALWLLVAGLFYVWTRMQLVQIGYEIAELEKQNNDLRKRKRELMLEIASLESPEELEGQARIKAGLVFPDMGKVFHVP